MSQFRLDPSSKKYICPACQKRRFVRFVTDENIYASENYGRCDREINCGYYLRPDQKYDDTTKFEQAILKKPDFVDPALVEKTLSHFGKNPLFNYLISKFEKDKVLKCFLKYKVGTSNYWGGSTIFWQFDKDNNVRGGKIIKYDSLTGKRIRDPRSLITWVHKVILQHNFNLVQVCFGEHLLNGIDDEDILCIVESEKTALIMAILYPEYFWIAVGSINNLNSKMLQHCNGRRIIAFPDCDAYEIWISKANQVSRQLQTQVKVSDFLLLNTSVETHASGFDLADYFLKESTIESSPIHF